MSISSSFPAHLKTGANAENLARRELEARGLEWVESNFKCRFGEIDLVMRDGETTVFVEVRLRSNVEYGGAAASIVPRKIDRLRRSAQCYLQRQSQWEDQACRFDLVLFDGTDEPGTFEWVANAF